MDFFTPIVDDPYSFGAIAAANALSDVYAMGGRPITAMNIACFDPTLAPAESWAQIFRGMADKCAEAAVAVVGGHSVEDSQPKFGLSVTGLVDPEKMMTNAGAEPGDKIYLSKPLGTGIVTTAAKFDDCPDDVLQEAIMQMSTLNKAASERAVAAGSRCATDVTGFGLVGHCFNVARASQVSIQIKASAIPRISGVDGLIEKGYTTAGAQKNREFMAGALIFEGVDEKTQHLTLDPQTSGGLAIFSTGTLTDYDEIGVVVEGPPSVKVTS